MAENWYYSIDEKNHGPLSFIDMKRLVSDRIVQPDTLVWNEQLADWLPAQESELVSLFTSGSIVEAAGDHHCSVCGKSFALNELIELNGSLTCAECKPQVLRMMQAGVNPAGYINYAGFWVRVGAAWLDGFVVGIPLVGIFVLLLMMNSSSGDFMSNMETIRKYQILLSIIALLYPIVMIATKGATLGQMAVKIKTVQADGYSKVGWGRSVCRALASLISQNFALLYLSVVFDSQKRTIHDMICSTRVVYTNK